MPKLITQKELDFYYGLLHLDYRYCGFDCRNPEEFIKNVMKHDLSAEWGRDLAICQTCDFMVYEGETAAIFGADRYDYFKIVCQE